MGQRVFLGIAIEGEVQEQPDRQESLSQALNVEGVLEAVESAHTEDADDGANLGAALEYADSGGIDHDRAEQLI